MSPSFPSPAVPVIRMRNLAAGSLHNPALPAVAEVDWEAAPGDYWVIAGLQGAGKTDFLMMAAGLMPPLRGSYEFLGEPMPIFDEARLRHRLRLGLVFDTGQLFHHLTVADNIALPLRYHHNLSQPEAAARVQELIDLLELGPVADLTPGALGRNWAKRAGLARALALKPEVLFLDTPESGLDPRHTRWWLGLLESLSSGHPYLGGRPVTLVTTTADLRPWRGRARQFAILRHQRLVVLGDWRQLEAASRELLQELLPGEPGGG